MRSDKFSKFIGEVMNTYVDIARDEDTHDYEWHMPPEDYRTYKALLASNMSGGDLSEESIKGSIPDLAGCRVFLDRNVKETVLIKKRKQNEQSDLTLRS